MESLETESRAHLLLYRPVVLFHNVVEILALPNFDRFAGLAIVRLDGGGVGPTLVDVDFLRRTVIGNGLTKKAQGRLGITFRSQQKIDGVASLVYSTIEVFPFTTNFDVGFVEPPADANPLFLLLALCRQERRVFHDPAVDRRVVDGNSTLRNQLLDVTVAEFVP